MYTARARPCTQSVHGHGRPCTRAENTAMYRVHGRPSCTRTAVYTDDRLHGRLPCTCYGSCTRPCSGHKRTMYKAHARPCTRSVHDPGRPCAQIVNTCRVDCRVHGRPCTPHKALFTLHVFTICAHGRPGSCTDRVHGRACTRPSVYRTAVRVPCTRPCPSRAHDGCSLWTQCRCGHRGN